MNRLAGAVPSLLAALVLSACNAGQAPMPPALLPATSAAPDPAMPAPAVTPVVTASVPPSAPVSLAQTRVELAPIVGSTVQAVAPLSERLAARARQSGYRLAAIDDPATTHVLKGYFSAFADGGQTTVVYVWDVLDPAGNRLHRIQGQEKTPGPASGFAGDPWAAVPPTTMQAIADRTIAELTAYLAKPAG